MKKVIIILVLSPLLVLIIWNIYSEQRNWEIMDSDLEKNCFGEPGPQRKSSITTGGLDLGTSTRHDLEEMFGDYADVTVWRIQTGFFPWETDLLCRYFFPNSGSETYYWLKDGRLTFVEMYDVILPYNDEEVFTLRDLQQIIGDPDSSFEIKIKDISQSELFWPKEGVFVSLSRRYNNVRSGENDCYVLNIETKIRKIAYFEPMGFLEATGNNLLKFESTTREIQWDEDQSSEPYYETEWLKNFCNE